LLLKFIFAMLKTALKIERKKFFEVDPEKSANLMEIRESKAP